MAPGRPRWSASPRGSCRPTRGRSGAAAPKSGSRGPGERGRKGSPSSRSTTSWSRRRPSPTTSPCWIRRPRSSRAPACAAPASGAWRTPSPSTSATPKPSRPTSRSETRQRIEIAGALAGGPDVLMLDEPTAVLSPDETAALFVALRRRAASGKAVVLITHRLAEVFAAADRLTLLARGRVVRSCRVGETTAEEIGSLLLAGAEASVRPAPPAAPAAVAPPAGAPALDLRDVVPLARPGERFRPPPPCSLSLAAGEPLVLLAIDGNGADALAASVAGLRGASGRSPSRAARSEAAAPASSARPAAATSRRTGGPKGSSLR